MKIRFHMTKQEWVNRKYHPDKIARRPWLERLIIREYDDTSRALPIRYSRAWDNRMQTWADSFIT